MYVVQYSTLQLSGVYNCLHHLVFGINRFIPSASPVLCRFTSSFACQPVLLIIPTLSIHHFFTLSLQVQNVPFRQIFTALIDFFYQSNFLHQTGLIMLISLYRMALKKRPELCVTITARILYRKKFPFAHL